MIDQVSRCRVNLEGLEMAKVTLRKQLNQAIVEQRTLGVPIAEIARRAGMSRGTIYTILNEEAKVEE